MLKAFIIDDDEAFQIHLKELLAKDHKDITIAGIFGNPEDALIALKADSPDMVFLDVEMPGLSGMQLLEHFPQRSFEVVFTTSHDKYAFNAIKQQATDYLLKPVSRIELATAVERIKNKLQVKNTPVQIPATQNPKIALSSLEGVTLVEIKQVIRCEADNNYTTFYLADGKKIVATKSIGDIEAQLLPYGFFRSHKSHLVNTNFIARIIKSEGGSIVMKDSSEVPVARSKKDELMEFIAGMG